MDDDTADDVGQVSRGDRPIAPGDLPGRHPRPDTDPATDLQDSIAELDAVAWNLPARRSSHDEEDVPETT